MIVKPPFSNKFNEKEYNSIHFWSYNYDKKGETFPLAMPGHPKPMIPSNAPYKVSELTDTTSANSIGF